MVRAHGGHGPDSIGVDGGIDGGGIDGSGEAVQISSSEVKLATRMAQSSDEHWPQVA